MNTWASWGLMWAGFLALWLALDTWMPAPPWRWIAQPTAHMVPLAPKPVKAVALSGTESAFPSIDIGGLRGSVGLGAVASFVENLRVCKGVVSIGNVFSKTRAGQPEACRRLPLGRQSN